MYESPIRVPILAVDPGNRSGWALFEPIPPTSLDWAGCWKVTTGACSPWTDDDPNAIGLDTVMRLADRALAAAFVVEKPGAGGRGKFMNMVVGLSETIGCWRRAWRMTRAKGAELGVVQATWRAGVLGGAGPSRDPAEWKAASKEHFRACVYDGKGFVLHGGVTGRRAVDDAEQADAFGLGWWALHSPALADELGVRRLAEAGWDDRAACLAAKAIRGKTEGGDDE